MHDAYLSSVGRFRHIERFDFLTDAFGLSINKHADLGIQIKRFIGMGYNTCAEEGLFRIRPALAEPGGVWLRLG